MTGGQHPKQFGVLSVDDRQGYSGLAFVQALVSGALPHNNMVRTLGYDILEASEGCVIVIATPNTDHLNPAGGVHGGLAATLLDSAMGLAVQSTLGQGLGSTTLEFKIFLLRPVTPNTGLIRAEGQVLKAGCRVSTTEGKLTDSQNRLLAHATTTCLVFEYPPEG
ncbi:MAG: PaaI family thioesterase [Alphaproteobacteria bacterium]|nr:PaaI family thioesterase [Alphaproteobacteria bacterium]